MTLEDAILHARQLCEEGVSVSDAAKQAAKLSGIKKSDIYRALCE